MTSDAMAAPERTADTIVGERIHMQLFRQRMTRRALAQELGLSEQTLSKKINAVTTFTLDELLMVASVLGVEVTSLLPDSTYSPLSAEDRRVSRRRRVRAVDPALLEDECAIRDSNPEPAD